MIDRTEETPDIANLTFSSPDEEAGYKAWIKHLAGELDFLSPDYAASHTNCVGVLIGDNEEPGQLSPGEDGYPVFYGAPFVEQATADDLLYYLYRAAFEPAEEREHRRGRTRAYLRVYANVYDLEKGAGNCAGIIDHGLACERADILIFHDAYIYMKDLSCETEPDLLNLYRRILESRTDRSPCLVRWWRDARRACRRLFTRAGLGTRSPVVLERH